MGVGAVERVEICELSLGDGWRRRPPAGEHVGEQAGEPDRVGAGTGQLAHVRDKSPVEPETCEVDAVVLDAHGFRAEVPVVDAAVLGDRESGRDLADDRASLLGCEGPCSEDGGERLPDVRLRDDVAELADVAHVEDAGEARVGYERGAAGLVEGCCATWARHERHVHEPAQDLVFCRPAHELGDVGRHGVLEHVTLSEDIPAGQVGHQAPSGRHGRRGTTAQNACSMLCGMRGSSGDDDGSRWGGPVHVPMLRSAAAAACPPRRALSAAAGPGARSWRARRPPRPA